MGDAGYCNCSLTNLSRLATAFQLGDAYAAIATRPFTAFSSGRTEEKGVAFAKSNA
jgi:hypothetical protein